MEEAPLRDPLVEKFVDDDDAEDGDGDWVVDEEWPDALLPFLELFDLVLPVDLLLFFELVGEECTALLLAARDDDEVWCDCVSEGEASPGIDFDVDFSVPRSDDAWDAIDDVVT